MCKSLSPVSFSPRSHPIFHLELNRLILSQSRPLTIKFFFSLAESLPRRSKLPDNIDSNNVCRRLSSNAKCSPKIGNNLSRSLSNLATNVDDHRKCPKNFPSTGMKPKQYSASSTSLSTIPGKKLNFKIISSVS